MVPMWLKHRSETGFMNKNNMATLTNSRTFLLQNRILFLDKDFDEPNCCDVIANIIALNIISKKPIILLINSKGGEVFSMFGLIDVIESSISPIYTVCIGAAISAAADVLISGHKRFALPNTTIMTHEVRYEPESVVYSELKNISKQYKKEMNQSLKHYKKHTKLSEKTIKDKIFIGDNYFTPEEALTLNLIDEIGWDIYEWIK
jgi:ATP-dependent Clp protease protease subunit